VSREKLNIAIVGLGFSKEFIPIYQKHPHTVMYAICQRTKEELFEVGDQYGVGKRYQSFEVTFQRKNERLSPFSSAYPGPGDCKVVRFSVWNILDGSCHFSVDNDNRLAYLKIKL
jgi:hypothetical protein